MLLAHQGGWDEILLALTPLVVVAALLWLANRRADALQAGRAEPGPGEPGPADQGAATGTDDPDPPEH